MEAVYGLYGIREAPPCDKAHGVGHIHGYLLNEVPSTLIDTHEGFRHLVGRYAPDDGYECPLPSTGGTIGHDGVKLTVARGRLIYADARTDILRIDKPLVGMLQLVPVAEATQMILILFLKGIGFDMVVLLKRTAGHWGTLHTFL